MRRFTIMILFIFLSLLSLVAEAQDESAECVLELPDGSIVDLEDDTFEGCSQQLIDEAFSNDLDEAYGYWGEYATYVSDNGDMYYVDENDEWVYWGTLGSEDDASSEDGSEDDGSSEEDTSEDGSSNSLGLDELFDLAKLDLDTFWEGVFAEYEVEYARPDVQVVEEGDVDTGCGAIGESTGPAYCGDDNTIYIALGFMEDQYERIGDFAVVVIIAHEWGHSVEQQLGFFDGSLYTQETELIADCLAGAYTNFVMNESEDTVLEEGDVDEAVTSLFESGDDLPWFDEESHGSGEQRMESFQNGLDTGVSACIE